MPFDAYRSIEAANSHGLMRVLQSPAHYLHARNEPNNPTPAMVLGSLIHLAVLEPAKFEAHVFCAPECDRRTKVGKALFEDFQHGLPPEHIIATPSQYETVRGVQRALLAHPVMAGLMQTPTGQSELTVVWQDPATGLDCKARFDRICWRDDRMIVIDLKSTSDASYKAFSRDAANMKYDVQAAHYSEGAKIVFGKAEVDFIFAAVETSEPYGAKFYVADEELFLSYGRRRRNFAMRTLADCIEKQDFPCYGVEIQNLGFPGWVDSDPEFMKEIAT